MRFFDLFLRRAGVDRAAASSRRGTSRLTVVCPRDALGAVRKQVCLDFSAAGLRVAQFDVDTANHAGELASACITVNCPPELRGELMSQARRLQANPAIRQVRFGGASRQAAHA